MGYITCRRVLTVFLMLGLVSLFADVVYEGGRSVSGAYLEYLGSPPIGPAFIGFGEFLGLALRFLTGYLATVYQSSALLWGLTASGYVLTAISIPLLSLAGGWGIAVVLYVVDRLGKGLRAPARDVILAEVSEGFGVGKGFGIHELLDQVGAFIGPILVATVLAYSSYRDAFLVLAIPGAIAVLLVLTSASMYPRLKSVRRVEASLSFRGLGRGFWLFTIASGVLALSFMHWSIASYYLTSNGILNDVEVGLTYAIAMIVDAAIAVPLGALLDREGLKVMLILPPLTTAFTLMVISSIRELALLSAIPWGIVICAEESVMRASIAKIVETHKRAMAYGTFSLVFGALWAIGGYTYSYLLTLTPLYPITYVITTSALTTYLYLKLASTTLKTP